MGPVTHKFTCYTTESKSQLKTQLMPGSLAVLFMAQTFAREGTQPGPMRPRRVLSIRRHSLVIKNKTYG